MGVPAIVLAGDRKASHPVFGTNKALLPLHGVPLVAHVVGTLREVPSISSVYVVGPQEALTRVLDAVPAAEGQPRTILPQGATMFENGWRSFLRTLTDDPEPDETQLAREHPDATVAVVTGDIPLITAHEVEDFLTRADMERYDYVLGITPIDALAPFEPRSTRLGMRMAGIHCDQGRFRQNNLHLVRPFALGHKDYIEEFYEFRYQKEWWNALRLIFGVLSKSGGTFSAVGSVVRMQAAMRAELHGMLGLAERVRKGILMSDLCDRVSRILQTRFSVLICDSPGATLDIDNEHDLAVMSGNFDTWRAALNARAHAA